jgi:hypothetical protein
MHEHDRNNLDSFFREIEKNLPGYQYANFSYVALKKNGAFELTQGRLHLQGASVKIPSRCFQSDNVQAGICRLAELNLTPKTFVDSLISGKIKTPHGELLFPPEEKRLHSTDFTPYYSDENSRQQRQIRLWISGDRRHRIESSQLDWELKAAPTPFFNIQELCDEFFVGPLRGDSVSVEIIAFNVAAIVTESSISGTKAKLVVALADGLDTEKAAIGYRVFDRNRVVARCALPGSKLEWTKAENIQQGVGEIEVPNGAVIDCIASYSGVAQSYYWIADPKTAQNPLRSIHDAFDNNLEVLQELIAKSQSKGGNARDLEIAISWLLWILGFSATHIGATSKTSDAPDLIASTPRGDLLVIECTTGILKEDSKLSHLFQRAEKIRQTLAASGNQHLKVLPIIVTTKTRDEIKSELEQAHKLGVLVATREDFQQLITRTMLFPDPNALYAEAFETLHKLQNPPPFSNLSGQAS